MKNIYLTFIGTLMLLAALPMQAQTQGESEDLLCSHCQQVAVAHYPGISISALPPYKVAYWCSFSKACFFETDSVPAGARVYSISEVVDRKTDTHLPSGYVVNLDSLNFFAFTFNLIQQRTDHADQTIYYATPSSAHAYLGVRSRNDAMRRIDNASLLQRYGDYPNDYFDTTK